MENYLTIKCNPENTLELGEWPTWGTGEFVGEENGKWKFETAGAIFYVEKQADFTPVIGETYKFRTNLGIKNFVPYPPLHG